MPSAAPPAPPAEGAVVAAIEGLLQALLAHPANGDARAAALQDGGPARLYRAALGVVYRLLVARASAERRARPFAVASTWPAVARLVSTEGPLGALGLAPDATALLTTCSLDDDATAALLATLAPVAPVDLGGLHQAMLARAPRLEGGALRLAPAARGRRTTGSFYTPASLVRWLLDAALAPAIAEALAAGSAALEAVRVCDPSCGAGAFLLPAAQRLAAARDPHGAAPDTLLRVVSASMYGIDLDGLAVFACQATLWLAALGPDTSEDHAHACADALSKHIQCGDALLGAEAAELAAGVPDLAFVAPTAGQRAAATAWRARNRTERARAAARAGPQATPLQAGLDLARLARAWCATFFWSYEQDAPAPPTTGTLRALAPATAARAERLAAEHGFFSWDAAFPDVGGFDVVLGNPPFLNQLERDTVASRPAAALLRARFPDELGAYTDTAALLLLLAARRLRPGGRLGMVQPQSILAASDTRAVRLALASIAPPTHLWWSGAHVFPGASVYVTALALRRAPPVATLLRAHGPDFAPLPALPLAPEALSEATWAPLVADALGAPALAPRTRGVLGDLATATADFRDEYYGLLPFVVDRRDADEARFPRLVLTGHIDPAWAWWGARPVRFGKRAWAAPRVDLAALQAAGGLAAWARARRVPKVLVATQTRVLEAVADPDGAWLTTTPTLSVFPRDPADVWRVAAVLLGPPASAWALTHFGASALAAGAIKLSARQVEAIPLPADLGAWDEAAAYVAAAHAEADPAAARAHLLAAGASMVRACGGDDALLTWWSSRLPHPPRGEEPAAEDQPTAR